MFAALEASCSSPPESSASTSSAASQWTVAGGAGASAAGPGARVGHDALILIHACLRASQYSSTIFSGLQNASDSGPTFFTVRTCRTLSYKECLAPFATGSPPHFKAHLLRKPWAPSLWNGVTTRKSCRFRKLTGYLGLTSINVLCVYCRTSGFYSAFPIPLLRRCL